MSPDENETTCTRDPDQRLMKVSIEIGGQFITTEVPTEASFQALFSEDKHLRGIDVLGE